MVTEFRNGNYPVMIVPYDRNGAVDYEGVKEIVKWYWENGCQGIFTVCQSTEMDYLSLKDRLEVARVTVETAKALAKRDKSRLPMNVVASGHVSYDFEAQVEELTAMAKTGIDALILVSNRFDIANTTEDKWIEEAECLLAHLPSDIMLGMYERPVPYKRILTEKMCRWMASTGRFAFIKDTCCDVPRIAKRLEIFKNTSVGLFNANGQTLLDTLKLGAKGYSGIMANFHPRLYSWICENYEEQPDKAEKVQDFLAMAAFTEGPVYPCSAKWHLKNIEGLNIEISSRQADERNVTDYVERWVKRMDRTAKDIEKQL